MMVSTNHHSKMDPMGRAIAEYHKTGKAARLLGGYIKYIADENHYKEVLSLVEKAKRTVWIGTAARGAN